MKYQRTRKLFEVDKEEEEVFSSTVNFDVKKKKELGGVVYFLISCILGGAS